MSLVMTEQEIKTFDHKVELMADWAFSRKAEAEQLAMDSARLLSCTADRMNSLRGQGFFKRCWSRFTGEAGAIERANTADLIQMQKCSLRYINMLQEQQIMMAHSMLSLKNNLLSLAVKEEETRNLIAKLAQHTLERFINLEQRVEQLEVSTNLQGWLLSLEEREYEERFPTDFMRLFQVINDFYTIKSDSWNYNDLMFMRKAIRTVHLNPKSKISLNTLIDSVTDEIQQKSVGLEQYSQSISRFQPQEVCDLSRFVLEEVSSPVFVSLHGLKSHYEDRRDVVEELSNELSIAPEEALKRLLRRSISNMNINLDYEFPLAEAAIEILGGMRMVTQIAAAQTESLSATSKNELSTADPKKDASNFDHKEIVNKENLDSHDNKEIYKNTIDQNNKLLHITSKTTYSEKTFLSESITISSKGATFIDKTLKHRCIKMSKNEKVTKSEVIKTIHDEIILDKPKSILSIFDRRSIEGIVEETILATTVHAFFVRNLAVVMPGGSYDTTEKWDPVSVNHQTPKSLTIQFVGGMKFSDHATLAALELYQLLRELNNTNPSKLNLGATLWLECDSNNEVQGQQQ